VDVVLDPNITYLVLVFGLWIGVSATYIPGTGIKELLAVVALVASAIMLGSMPTNWLAVLVLVIGVLSFIVMPFLKQQLMLLSIGGLVLQGAGAWLMFNGLQVSPLVIALTVVIPLLYHRYILMPVFTRVRQQPILDEDDLLIGAHGRVIKALNPTGTINVRGEMWTATSDRPLEAGDEVIVVERAGLQVIVEGVKHKRTPSNGYEEPVL
jgi:membrane-bound serine protease (ClpP class)